MKPLIYEIKNGGGCKMLDKTERYRRLVKEVSSCTDCDKIKSKSKSKKTNGTIVLEHDKNRTEINLWSHWQGSLDAEIMVIGQDWGRLPDMNEMSLFTSGTVYPSILGDSSSPKSPTDENLVKLFFDALKIDAAYKNDRLFFTNSILCYKTGNLSGKTCDGWHKQCNEKYIVRLVDIIRPKITIALGAKALHGLQKCGTFTPNTGSKIKLKALVENNTPIALTLRNSNFSTTVFPVYHCGSFSRINRPHDKQIKDWQRIVPYLN